MEKQSFLRNLPLINFTTELYPDADLKDTYIICAQHLVSTTYSLFHALLNLGIKPYNISAIGKCYSTDPEAYLEMEKIGIDVCSTSLLFDSHRSFDQQYSENVKNFLNERRLKIMSKEFKKIIVLDDGGELILKINDVAKRPNVVGIEQTSSGFYKLRSETIRFPIINVARSYAKINFESPVIANLVVDALMQQIKHLHLERALIIGSGSIGSHVNDVFKSICEISTYDKIFSRSSINTVDFIKSLSFFDVIIGCTGQTVLGPEHYSLLKEGAVLVSASSSDREFDAVHLRRKASIISNCHENLYIEGIQLINCGFPVNFSSQFRSIDVEELQLTRSLLLSAVLQANSHSNVSKSGFIDLDIENQMEIIRKYLSLEKSACVY